MMVREALARIECAEQYFDFFALEFDPRVLAVYRLRLLKRFGMEKAEIDSQRPEPDLAERLVLYAQALRRAHDQFARRLAEGVPGQEAEPGCTACVGCGTA
jgi:nitrogenase-stabilizing/protective protein